VPVDTGGLKQSIKTFHSGKKAFVEAGKKYAPFVEFGTGSKVDLTDMKALGIPESYAKQFKGKGIRDINLPARPFLFPSARTEFLNLLKRITDKLKKLT
jgi:phage gpG-like protein